MTDIRFKALSGYNVMWVWTLFDLPVGTRTERKNATRFRNFLLDLGFEMVQFSVYARHAWTREKAEVYAAKVGERVPPGGNVQVLFITDKQFGMTKVYRGREKPSSPPGKPEQLLLF